MVIFPSCGDYMDGVSVCFFLVDMFDFPFGLGIYVEVVDACGTCEYIECLKMSDIRSITIFCIYSGWGDQGGVLRFIFGL